ncbi:MAG: hypothetical protein FH756_01705 [Firmicutes bacterium]|nr:hypothetical protein [Bacillota bacterium]
MWSRYLKDGLAAFDRKHSKDKTTEGQSDFKTILKEKLAEKFTEKGSIKITVEGLEDKPSVAEEVNEFVLITRTGNDVELTGKCNKLFLMAAIAQIKQHL